MLYFCDLFYFYILFVIEIEFVIEKYIEIIKGISISIMYKFMLIQILALLVLLDNEMIGSTFIYFIS